MIMEGIWRRLHIPFFMVIARLGKVDQNGKLVVKYKYDVYCNNKGIEDTNMYYCKSRFYVPKWRRCLKCALCVGTSALVLFRKLYKENNMISNQNK